MQQTLKKELKVNGVGAHSGKTATVNITPAPENSGIIFKRIDIASNNTIKASFKNVCDTTMCTVISNASSIKVSTVEHLMSAFWGAGVDNALVEIDGPEVPILDGSSIVYLGMIKEIGLKKQKAPRKYVKVKQVIEVGTGDKRITIMPNEAFSVEFTIDFDHKLIGQQKFRFQEQAGDFEYEISKARTFGFFKDLNKLLSLGFAKGCSLDNVVCVDEEGVMNKDGLRYQNEFVRHKILDCIGDLYLAGMRIKGHVQAYRSGHALNVNLLQEIFSNPDCYEIVDS